MDRDALARVLGEEPNRLLLVVSAAAHGEDLVLGVWMWRVPGAWVVVVFGGLVVASASHG